jgi:hypothetical protein
VCRRSPLVHCRSLVAPPVSHAHLLKRPLVEAKWLSTRGDTFYLSSLLRLKLPLPIDNTVGGMFFVLQCHAGVIFEFGNGNGNAIGVSLNIEDLCDPLRGVLLTYR